MSPHRRPLRIALAGVLVLSAGAFAWGSHVERSKEASGPNVAAEGSLAREGAERAASSKAVTTTPPPTTATAPGTGVPTTTLTTPTAPPTTLKEGSLAREAAERAARASTIPLPTTPLTLPPTASVTASSLVAAASAPTTSVPATSVEPLRSTPTGETLFGLHTESTATAVFGVVALALAALVALVSRRRWPLHVVALIAALFATLDIHEAIHQHDEGRGGLVALAVGLAALHTLAAALAFVAGRSEAHTDSRVPEPMT